MERSRVNSRPTACSHVNISHWIIGHILNWYHVDVIMILHKAMRVLQIIIIIKMRFTFCEVALLDLRPLKARNSRLQMICRTTYCRKKWRPRRCMYSKLLQVGLVFLKVCYLKRNISYSHGCKAFFVTGVLELDSRRARTFFKPPSSYPSPPPILGAYILTGGRGA